MSEIFIHESRGKIVESIHRGDAVVVRPGGAIVAECGDLGKVTYFRSSAKPIQAMQVVLSGAADHFELTDQELAVICSSHYAEDFHLEAVSSILKKIGLDENALLCGPAMSLMPEVAEKHCHMGFHAEKRFSDCTGKHAGMLAVCKYMDYPIENYIDPNHPLQKEILQIISDVCEYPADKISIGIDGCSVPVFGIPIFNMALGFVNMANSAYLPEKYRDAADRIFSAMNTYPEMVSGTGGFCTMLMSATDGRMIGKVGAQGVYCIGIRDPQMGIALKIEDGMPGMASMAAMQILVDLHLLKSDEYRKLSCFHKKQNLNDDNIPVGMIEPVFHMLAVL
ncbi:MAG TPA: asparaginase [Candidatus Cloacimonadota bacterium]|nr:asparaginase [Candidatus Cloacimonadota bacterium]HPT71046.1 asparaginase [Candidatus Cloacimonadota bacterium]